MKTLLFLLLPLLSFSQDITGRWNGGCTNVHGERSATTLDIRYISGNLYKVKGYESWKGVLNTFEFQFFYSNGGYGRVPTKNFSNLNMNGAKISIRSLHTWEQATYYKTVALCNDGFEFIVGTDGRREYMEFNCVENLKFWSLSRPVPITNFEMLVIKPKCVRSLNQARA
jgi:hypothetical protein